MEKTNYIGVAIGGTKSAVSFGSYDGEKITVLKKIAVTTYADDSEKTLSGLLGAVDEFKGEFSAIGIMCGGPLDSENGVIICPPNLPGCKNVKIKEIMETRYGVPCAVLNDKDACALAEN
ncbi:MAG: ROK family protein, partial [Clostridia bacterium]|nr:ROK family protein [Clostridia bacterium]